MTTSDKYLNTYIPVKHFLNSYRALRHGELGIQYLEKFLESPQCNLWEWKIIWIGTCAVLRTAVELFKIDATRCIDQSICREICNEWKSIKSNEDDHKIFWCFLRKERNNILHEYEWSAHEMWLDQDGTTHTPYSSLFQIKPNDVKSVLIMKGGSYEGCNSLTLLGQSAEWVKTRIYSAIERAGLDPDEERNLVTFECRPPFELSESGLLNVSEKTDGD